jgi:hypothetical protein
VSGPSGAGYVYLDELSQTNLDIFTTRSSAYSISTGVKVINVWNTISSAVGTSYGALPLIAKSTAIGDWEKFDIIVQ